MDISDEFSDPEWVTEALLRAVEEAAGPVDPRPCDDCGKGIRIAAHSVITHDLQSRRYCHACARVRETHGWIFDARPIAALQAEVA